MSWLLRPSILVLAWAARRAGGAADTCSRLQGCRPSQALPRPVPAGDQEIVWLNAATNAVAWSVRRGGPHVGQSSPGQHQDRRPQQPAHEATSRDRGARPVMIVPPAPAVKQRRMCRKRHAL